MGIETETSILKFLSDHPTELDKYNKLSNSHKREYIKWIEEAKKDETKNKRLQIMLTFLNQ
ncbi:hypothetical protein EP331_12160 [bacterium]|nr:MAG: hypothetical protein EP331_12160 [bacterium]